MTNETTPFGLVSSVGFEFWNINVTPDGNLEFNSNSNDAGGGNLRLLINDDSGNVGIGTNNPSTKLEINSEASHGLRITTNTQSVFAMRIFNSNSAASRIHEAGMFITNDGFFHVTNRINGNTGFARLDSTGRWTVFSDSTVKKEVETASDLLEKTLSLRPVSFYYMKQNIAELPHKFIGLVAQEVEQVFPHLVNGSNSNKYLDYGSLSAIAIGAIKEMKEYYDKKITKLESELKQLHSKLDSNTTLGV